MNSVTRFSNRVDDYVKYRPSYPPEILNPLRSNCGLTEKSVIADVGSGTGLLSSVFLNNGNKVLGIEPNELMRVRAESAFKSVPKFESIAATAENTSLPEASVDFVVAGQAFHWFDRGAARREFVRILKSEGWVMLVWNARKIDASDFLQAYESLLLRYSNDYSAVRHENAESGLAQFFAPQQMFTATFDNVQRFDYEGLKGRLCSSSYAPSAGNPVFETMMAELRDIFEKYNENGLVNFEYDTKMFYGHL